MCASHILDAFALEDQTVHTYAFYLFIHLLFFLRKLMFFFFILRWKFWYLLYQHGRVDTLGVYIQYQPKVWVNLFHSVFFGYFYCSKNVLCLKVMKTWLNCSWHNMDYYNCQIGIFIVHSWWSQFLIQLSVSDALIRHKIPLNNLWHETAVIQNAF